ncbi:4418_t:CDS:2 [Acaulospora morrowiae]|uniref:4418_t:CDS:1 n=1 Tax=Acaulospora morrowiae TaxID=94023 RepID=A0A9N8W4L8_9GLOM|nr:4418_t:CDS:2 [Acaulospora morrowiae]
MPKGKKKEVSRNLPTMPVSSAMDLDDDPPDFLPEAPVFTKVATDDAAYKTWVCLYPVYFDSKKTVQQGRKVRADIAVPNPLAVDIAESVKTLGVSCVFEPRKTHPTDWKNPGRVRARLFTELKKPSMDDIPTRKELIKRVAELLPEIQKKNPQQFPPPHSPAISNGASKETKTPDAGATSSSSPSSSTSGPTPVGGGSGSSTSSKKKGRKGRK